LVSSYRYQVELKIVSTFLPLDGLILDAGCGQGRVSRFLSMKGYEVIGVDTSREDLVLASHIIGKEEQVLEYIQADVSRLPFREQVFSAVVFLGTFIYFEKINSAIIEANRVSKKNSVVMLNFTNADVFPLRNKMNEFRTRLKRKMIVDKETSVLPRTVYRHTKEVALGLASNGYSKLNGRGLFAIMPGDVGMLENLTNKMKIRLGDRAARMLSIANDMLTRLKMYHLVSPDVIYIGRKSTTQKRSD
jgi:SAM-dependent methyltransferase